MIRLHLPLRFIKTRIILSLPARKIVIITTARVQLLVLKILLLLLVIIILKRLMIMLVIKLRMVRLWRLQLLILWKLVKRPLLQVMSMVDTKRIISLLDIHQVQINEESSFLDMTFKFLGFAFHLIYDLIFVLIKALFWVFKK